MRRRTLFIRREAFYNLVLAAIESFRKECLGEVFGLVLDGSDGSDFVVTDVLPLQCMRIRSCAVVEQAIRAEKRVSASVRALVHRYGHLGSFHSHPEFRGYTPPVCLSGEDLEYIEKERTKLEIVLTIKSSEKGEKLRTRYCNGGRTISVSLPGYFLRIAAFAFEMTNKRKVCPVRLKLRLVGTKWLAKKSLKLPSGSR